MQWLDQKTRNWRLVSAILEPTYIIVTTEQYIHDSYYFKIDMVQKMPRLMVKKYYVLNLDLTQIRGSSNTYFVQQKPIVKYTMLR